MYKDKQVSKVALAQLRKRLINGAIVVLTVGFIWYLGYKYALSSVNRFEETTKADEGNTGVDSLDLDQLISGFKAKYPTYQLKGAGDGIIQVDIPEEVIETIVEQEEKEDEIKEQMKEEEQEIHEEIEATVNDDGSIYVDQKEYDAAPFIKVPFPKPMKKNLWWSLKTYEKYYKIHPIRSYVPRIKPHIQLTRQMFYDEFIRHGQPVIFSFDNLRDLGFKTKSYTLDELQTLFPYTPSDENSKVVQEFVANGIRNTDEELDLGPAIASIIRDENLAKKGRLRNFPRNLKVKESAIEKLGIEKPPLIDDMTKFQLPTVWMGTSSSDTRFHHDCCDNFVMMISGTKRFTLAPTTDWRTLNPTCVGAHKSLCWASVAHPNEPNPTPRVAKTMSKVHKMVVDIAPGEILYMPAGWFHHIQNLGPTVMVNWWTKGKEQVGLLNALKQRT